MSKTAKAPASLKIEYGREARVFGKWHTAQLLGYRTGNCETKQQAYEELESTIREALDDRTPKVLSFRGEVVIVLHRGPYGWTYQRINQDTIEADIFGSGSETREKAIDHAWAYLLQLTWKQEDGVDGHPCFAHLSEWEQDNHRTWARFQLRYKQALAHGLSPDDATDYAGRNPARPELWEQELGEIE